MCAVALCPGLVPFAAVADQSAGELASPVAVLISVPMQLNYDTDIAPADDGDRYCLNVPPVVSIALNQKSNVIPRAIIPRVTQDDIVPGSGRLSGLGDTVQFPK